MSLPKWQKKNFQYLLNNIFTEDSNKPSMLNFNTIMF